MSSSLDRKDSDIKSNIRFCFSGATVLVTGGTAGIGREIAQAFADAGAQVIITGTRATADDYEDLPSPVRYYPLNLSEPQQIEPLIKELDKLDILINNAGATMPEATFEQSINVNLIAVEKISNACRPLLMKSQLVGGASIINFASMMSFFGSPYFPGYGAAKAAVVQLTKTHAAAWAEDKIRVNTIAPGSIETRMTQSYVADKTVKKTVEDKTPMARWGSCAEIAGPALFLCSEAASFITGHSLVVDGGYSIIDS